MERVPHAAATTHPSIKVGTKTVRDSVMHVHNGASGENLIHDTKLRSSWRAIKVIIKAARWRGKRGERALLQSYSMGRRGEPMICVGGLHQKGVLP